MKTLGLALLALAAAGPAGAAEVTARGIAVPFYNEAGQLTHKLTAARGALAGDRRRLEQIEIRYFSLAEPATVVQRVVADEAIWDEKTQTLSGPRRVVVTTEENTLSGEGFDFALATSRLHLHRNFRMENREVVVTSDRATAELLVARSGDEFRFRDVKWCEATGNLQIEVQPTATRTYLFQQAWSETARYEGATRIVTLPRPVRGIDRKGQAGTIDKLEIQTGAKR